MVLGRHYVWYDELRREFPRSSRPKVKIPCSRCSPSRSRKDSRLSPVSTSSSSSSSVKLNGSVLLSTPSPSATANGNKVDIEFEKFRKISQEWIKNRDIEESENKVFGLRSRTPSPPRNIPVSKYFRRSTSQPSDRSWRDSLSSSPRTSPDRTSNYSFVLRRSESPFRSLRSKSPSPIIFSPITKTFIRSYSLDRDPGYESRSSRSSSPRDSSLPPSILRKTSKYDSSTKYNTLPSRSFSPGNYPPVACSYRRASSLEKDKTLYNNFRSRSTSPQRLTPATSYYRKSETSTGLYSNPRNSEKQSSSNHFIDRQNHKMTSTRRFSEEPTPFRKPLATLHEDEIIARRRFSDDLRKKSFDTSDVARDAYNHQRKMSEAGVRKHSDATVVLTEDTDSFIIGDRIWVGGTKPGSISYIGETQFAPGEWAGITLDETIGKNDGMVAGVRYFQCEPKKGIFSRLTRLSLEPLSERDLEIVGAKSHANKIFDAAKSTDLPSSIQTERKITPSSMTDSFRRTSLANEASRKITPSSSGARSPSYTKSGSPAPSSVKRNSVPSGSGNPSDLRIGDRVIIDSTTGTKYGVLLYLGRTEFANGNWAGVELDEPSGKNDGSVAGKKYFVCRSKFGLFAPVSRVRAVGGRSSVPRSSATPMRRSVSPESIGGSSVASSNVSSLKGTRRLCSRSTTSSTSSPSTKALQRYEYYEEEDWFY